MNPEWNGCFTIPRIVSLESEEIRIQPSPVLEKLRDTYFHFEEQSAILNFHEGCGELIAKFAKDKQCSLDIYCDPEEKFTIHYDPESSKLQMGDEHAHIQSKTDIMKLHLFVDRSVLELFINDKECFTSRFYPDDYKDIIVDCKVPGIEFTSIDSWKMKPMSQKFQLE
jgi:beta-fructofuranosidase